MPEFEERPFDASEENEVSVDAEAEAAATSDGLDFLADYEQETTPAPAEFEEFLTVHSPSTGSRYVVLQPGQTMTASEALSNAGVYTIGQFSLWVDGVQIQPDHIVASGAKISIQGIAKGA